MKKLLSKPKVIICICALLISIIGLLVMMLLGLKYVFVWNPSGGIITVIKEFVLGMPITFFFLLIGVAYIGYEGRGTPRNIAINLGFHAFLFLTVIFLSILIYISEKSKKIEQEKND